MKFDCELAQSQLPHVNYPMCRDHMLGFKTRCHLGHARYNQVQPTQYLTMNQMLIAAYEKHAGAFHFSFFLLNYPMIGRS